MRIIVTLACTECNRRNYTTTKNKRTTPDKLELINTADFVANIRHTGRRNSHGSVILFLDAAFEKKYPSVLGWNKNVFILDELILLKIRMQASSSNGRASDSKSGGWGFESLLACHFLIYEAQRSKVKG